MLLGRLGASLLGNILSGRGINKIGKGINRAGEGIVRVGYGHSSLNCSKYKNDKIDL